MMPTMTSRRRTHYSLTASTDRSSPCVSLLLLFLCILALQVALAPLPVTSFMLLQSSLTVLSSTSSLHRPTPWRGMAKQKRPFTLLLSSRSDDRIDPVILPQEDEGGGHSATDNSSITNWEQEEQGQDFSTERLREQRQLTKRRVPIVGDPQQRVKEKERSVTSILKELAAIQQQGPQKYCMLGTRHCSYLHQQIIELLAYALVLSGNHVYTSGAGGTHAATIRGALRAERPDLLTVVLPQSLSKQPTESQELLHKVREVVAMPHNDELSLDVASRICNSYLLSQTDQLIAFAFHESTTVIEATKEAKTLHMLVTVLYLD